MVAGSLYLSNTLKLKVSIASNILRRMGFDLALFKTPSMFGSKRVFMGEILIDLTFIALTSLNKAIFIQIGNDFGSRTKYTLLKIAISMLTGACSDIVSK